MPCAGGVGMALGNDLRVIWFDQDDTLYDYTAAMWRSLAVALAVMQEALPEAARGLDVDRLARIRMEVALRCDAAGMDLMEGRREGFREALARCGTPDERIVGAMADAYFGALRTGIRPLPETEPCLQELGRRWELGVLSNGIALVEGLGLARHFRHLLYTEDVGLRKPQVEFFRLAERTAGVRPEQCLLVGDSAPADVMGARAAGWHAVWLNRDGRAWTHDAPPPRHIITSLSELPDLVAATHRSRVTSR